MPDDTEYQIRQSVRRLQDKTGVRAEVVKIPALIKITGEDEDQSTQPQFRLNLGYKRRSYQFSSLDDIRKCVEFARYVFEASSQPDDGVVERKCRHAAYHDGTCVQYNQLLEDRRSEDSPADAKGSHVALHSAAVGGQSEIHVHIHSDVDVRAIAESLRSRIAKERNINLPTSRATQNPLSESGGIA